MIERLIDWCARNRFLVFTGTLVVTSWGIWAISATPVDAVPDISDVQVIVSTEWVGRSPDLIEDQVTYPIISALISTPGVSTVRGFTDFGISYVYVIFEDGTDIYWARSRVVEYLQGIRGQLPEGVNPIIGPDATGVGWVFEYALVDETGQHTLADLRGFQDWYLRYWLASVPGVAEVASIGGFVQQYQVNLDPARLAAYDLGVKDVVDAIRASNNDVEGRLLEFAGREYMVRGRGYLSSVADIEQVSLGADPRGTPIRVSDVARVQLGPDIRRGVAELDGRGEVVGGIVVMRFGENAMAVIDRVKARLRDVQAAMPAGVTIVPTYDRSRLIGESIASLRETLIEEAVVVSLVIILFLFHIRSALVPILALPVAVAAAFIPMYYLGVTVQHHVARRHRAGDRRPGRRGDRDGGERVPARVGARRGRSRRLRGSAARRRRRGEAGRARDLLLARDHRRVVRAGVSARGAGRPDVPAARVHQDVRHGRRGAVLDHARPGADGHAGPGAQPAAGVAEPDLAAGGSALRADPGARAALALGGAAGQRGGDSVDHPARSSLIGSEFMPPLYEGSLLYMPTAPPGLSVTEATRLLQVQDKVLREFPEVERVFGTVGRGTSATDNSPMGMVNTTVTLKPREQWRPGMTLEALQSEMDAALQFPGLPNVWTQPIRNRLDMLSTGIKTPVGIKIFGPDLERHRTPRRGDRAGTRARRRHAQRLRRARHAGLFHRHHHRPRGDRSLRAHDRGRPGRHPVGARRREHHADDRRPGALPGQRALRARLPREHSRPRARARQDAGRRADAARPARGDHADDRARR